MAFMFVLLLVGAQRGLGARPPDIVHTSPCTLRIISRVSSDVYGAGVHLRRRV